MRSSAAVAVAALLTALVPARSQTLFARFDSAAARATAEQPGWATPLITVSPRVEQGFRTDFVRESLPAGQSTWNYGNAKGLQIVPFARVELRFSPPPFIAHSNPRTPDGFGDTGLRIKYRILASPESRRNAILTAELGATVPTGKNGNGSCCAILTPALEAGKGFGQFAFTLDAAGTLPVTGANTLGRQLILNEAAEFHATALLWLEAEFNSTLFRGGKNDGRQQTFITPGVIVSRMKLWSDRPGAANRLSLTLGAGEQIALTHFNTYNHAPVLTARLRF